MGKNLCDLEGKNHYSELERVDIHQMKTRNGFLSPSQLGNVTMPDFRAGNSCH